MTDRLLTIADLQTIFTRSRTSIWRDINANRLPKPLRLGITARWTQASIDQFIANGGNADA